MNIEDIIGVERVKQSNTEISYEDLTRVFDHRIPCKKVLDDVVYQFNVLYAAISARKVEGQRTPISELEIKKLAFLYRMTMALRRVGFATNDTLILESMKWLANEK